VIEVITKYFHQGSVVLVFLVLSISLVYAQPQLQVIPETIDFGEVEPYSPQVEVEGITISNCGDGILCWGVEADDDWLSVEGTSMGVINLPAGDQKYVQVSLGACGLCIVPQLQSEGKDPVGIHAGKFLVKQYAYDALTETCDPLVVLDQQEINTAMTISEYNMLRVEPNELDFGALLDEYTFLIKNNGQGEMSWQATLPVSVDWFTIDGDTTASGTIVSGGSETIKVRIDRSRQEGCAENYSASIRVTSPNASPSESAVTVTMQRDLQSPQPSYPTPAGGTIGQSLYSTLKWWEAESQENVGGIVHAGVYFSADRSLVENESFSVLICDNLTVPYCDPNRGGSQLSPNTTYYWKVRAVDECTGDPPVYSDIWSFTTTAAVPGVPCFTSLALPLNNSEMDTLRRLRDEVLAASPEGKRLINIYYSPHAVEALVMAFFNPELRIRAYSLVKELFPVLQSTLRGEPAQVSTSTVIHGDQLLSLFAREASPGLKKVIEAVREGLVSGLLLETCGFHGVK
jgi:hypothetical protein